MRKTLGLIIVLGLAATPALAQKVNIDYAHDFDFSGVKTFQYVETKESDSKNPMMQDRMVSAIKRELTEGTLIIDAYEPTDKKMVWRGTGTVTVKSTPEKQIKQIDKILSKLGSKWDKILAGQGK